MEDYYQDYESWVFENHAGNDSDDLEVVLCDEMGLNQFGSCEERREDSFMTDDWSILDVNHWKERLDGKI